MYTGRRNSLMTTRRRRVRGQLIGLIKLIINMGILLELVNDDLLRGWLRGWFKGSASFAITQSSAASRQK